MLLVGMYVCYVLVVYLYVVLPVDASLRLGLGRGAVLQDDQEVFVRSNVSEAAAARSSSILSMAAMEACPTDLLLLASLLLV